MPTSLPPHPVPTGFDPDKFRIEVVPEPPGVGLRLYGEVDLSSVDLIRDAMEQVTAEPVPFVVLDLGGVTFFAVCGLRALVAAHNAVEADGGRLLVRKLPPCVRRLVSLSRLDRVLDVR
jgi:anti-sigma B factor antagonist